MDDFQELDNKYVAYMSGENLSGESPWKCCYKYYHGKITIEGIFVDLCDEHDGDYECITTEEVFDTEEDCKKFIKERNFETLKWITEQATYIVDYMKTF